MSILTVYHDMSPELPNKVLTHAEDIATTLAEQGIHFEQWLPTVAISRDSADEQILAAYQHAIYRVQAARAYRTAAVVRIGMHTEQREPFLREHRLSEDRAQFFVTGRGLVCVHVGDYVYALQCEKHDLIVVPAGIAHWLDMGEQPNFIAIRLGASTEGAGPAFTGDDIASRWPLLDD